MFHSIFRSEMIYPIVLCALITLSHQTKDIENIVKLSTKEEECITETRIDRNVVLADKLNRDTSKDTLLNTYLGCYAHKLADAGELYFTKNIHVQLPGYNTPYEITSLYCDENDYSPGNPIRPCVQRI
ncbi:hypothetical protein RI129_002418 [Pyrocoelia pectoralis]|uniref:Uncharacterized protein n=1 Tax=Pyrocoelia pectoralis TaxID=417401 RepID=A0AAN7ZT16_9COLE